MYVSSLNKMQVIAVWLRKKFIEMESGLAMYTNMVNNQFIHLLLRVLKFKQKIFFSNH